MKVAPSDKIAGRRPTRITLVLRPRSDQHNRKRREREERDLKRRRTEISLRFLFHRESLGCEAAPLNAECPCSVQKASYRKSPRLVNSILAALCENVTSATRESV